MNTRWRQETVECMEFRKVLCFLCWWNIPLDGFVDEASVGCKVVGSWRNKPSQNYYQCHFNNVIFVLTSCWRVSRWVCGRYGMRRNSRRLKCRRQSGAYEWVRCLIMSHLYVHLHGTLNQTQRGCLTICCWWTCWFAWWFSCWWLWNGCIWTCDICMDKFMQNVSSILSS